MFADMFEVVQKDIDSNQTRTCRKTLAPIGDDAVLLTGRCPHLPHQVLCCTLPQLHVIACINCFSKCCYAMLPDLQFYPRWSQKHSRPLLGDEMLAIMGMPTSDKQAEHTRTCKAHVGAISSRAKAGLCMIHS